MINGSLPTTYRATTHAALLRLNRVKEILEQVNACGD
jgi:hypothetical protein